MNRRKSLILFRIVESSEIEGKFDGLTGLSWIPSPTEDDDSIEVTSETSPTEPSNNDGSDTDAEPLNRSLEGLESLSKETIDLVASMTSGQSSADGSIWKILRQKRLTASLFGPVLQVRE